MRRPFRLLALLAPLAAACGDPAGTDEEGPLRPIAAYRLTPVATSGAPDAGRPFFWLPGVDTIVGTDLANANGVAVRTFAVSGGSPGIIVTDDGGGYPHNVVHLPASAPQHVFFAYFLSTQIGREVDDLAVIRATTGTPRVIDTLALGLDVPNIAVSADGGAVAYVTGNRVIVRDVATGTTRDVASAGLDIDDPHGLRAPYALSPDGTRLLVSTAENGTTLRRWELYDEGAAEPSFVVRTGIVSTATGSEQTIVADVRWDGTTPELLLLRRTSFTTGGANEHALFAITPGEASPRLLGDMGSQWSQTTRAWWTPEGNAQFLSERSLLEIVEVAGGTPRVRFAAFLSEVFGAYRAFARVAPDGRTVAVGTALQLYVGELQ